LLSLLVLPTNTGGRFVANKLLAIEASYWYLELVNKIKLAKYAKQTRISIKILSLLILNNIIKFKKTYLLAELV